ncbi:c-type cytochrome domain-containing protein [Prosthecobacter sp.]|uniref:c-type cytochrome domain-containing protein n=1 Tax=Prosthecobacter sp. TaxID=1965333 RepID=UPI003784010E
MSSNSPETDEPKSLTAAWIATILLIVVYVVGLLIFPPLYDAPKGEASSTVLFIGRFHPIFLHLPVGILALLVFFELICSTRRGEQKFGAASLLMLILGSAGSVLAVFAGIMLSREGGYVGGNFSLHQTMGLLGTAGVLVALVVRLIGMARGSMELLNAYRALYFVSFGIMGLGAHFGGNMSHGNKFLIEHAPDWFKVPMVATEKLLLSFVEKPKPAKTTPPAETTPPVTPAPPAEVKPEVKPVAMDKGTTPPPAPTTPPPAPAAGGDEKLVFQHVILPVLTAKCNKCHSEEKSKGDLRMDTYEMAMKGGENGKNFVAGNLKDSLSIVRILLPEDDEPGEHMPPKGKEQLTPEEIALLKWWVEQGASGTQKVKDAKFPAELQATVDGILKG